MPSASEQNDPRKLKEFEARISRRDVSGDLSQKQVAEGRGGRKNPCGSRFTKFRHFG